MQAVLREMLGVQEDKWAIGNTGGERLVGWGPLCNHTAASPAARLSPLFPVFIFPPAIYPRSTFTQSVH